MKAAVLREVNTPLLIEEVSVSKPKSHEVLIRTAACGVCHSDLHYIEGKYAGPMPMILGHESAGVVEQVGAEVTYVKPGDHVITCLSVFCGHCEYCTTGRPFSCENPEVDRSEGEESRLSDNGAHINQWFSLGSFAEQMLVHEHALVKIRKDMPLDRAALIGCGVTTGFGAVINTADIEVGSTVAVIGCGGVGLSCINGAAIAGAGTHHRGRHQGFQAEPGQTFRRDRCGQCCRVRPCRGGEGADRWRCGIFVRGAGHEDHQRTGLPHAAHLRHGHDHRHGARGRDPGNPRRRPAERQGAARFEHGVERIPPGHARVMWTSTSTANSNSTT